jgi:hypothetical protein
MRVKEPFKGLLILGFILPQIIFAQNSGEATDSLKTLAMFEQPAGGIMDVSDVIYNPNKATSLKKVPGNGVIFIDATKSGRKLIRQVKYNDLELDFDFLVGKNTKASLIIHGLYKVDLSDSWGATNGPANAMGSAGLQGAGASASFGVSPPLLNVARAPGLWQHLKLRFRAPKTSNGKIANATIEDIYINGCLIQQSLEVQDPSGNPPINSSNGSIMFEDSYGILALKNIAVRKLAPPVTVTRPTGRRFNRVTNPIVIVPEAENYLLRSFLNFGTKKRTHVISVGSPKELNYSYDLKQGAILQIWNGPFLDVTEMWEQRGEPQLAKPLGSVIQLSEQPAFGILPDLNAPWPDSVSFDNFHNKGYVLDKQRNPTFEYETSGYQVGDKISFTTDSRSLRREFSVTGIPANLYCRIAKSSAINPLGKGLYVLGDKSYYVQLDEKLKPVIRNTPAGVELLVPVIADRQVSYSMIW